MAQKHRFYPLLLKLLMHVFGCTFVNHSNLWSKMSQTNSSVDMMSSTGWLRKSMIFLFRSFVSTSQWRIQNFPKEGAPTPKSAIILHIFCWKPHENERFWIGGGGGLDPPMPPLREDDMIKDILLTNFFQCWWELYSEVDDKSHDTLQWRSSLETSSHL